jgi:hypothetical protein
MPVVPCSTDPEFSTPPEVSMVVHGKAPLKNLEQCIRYYKYRDSTQVYLGKFIVNITKRTILRRMKKLDFTRDQTFFPALNMKAVVTSKMMVNIYQITRRHIKIL